MKSLTQKYAPIEKYGLYGTRYHASVGMHVVSRTFALEVMRDFKTIWPVEVFYLLKTPTGFRVMRHKLGVKIP